jgi:hypothetical protein
VLSTGSRPDATNLGVALGVDAVTAVFRFAHKGSRAGHGALSSPG